MILCFLSILPPTFFVVFVIQINLILLKSRELRSIRVRYSRGGSQDIGISNDKVFLFPPPLPLQIRKRMNTDFHLKSAIEQIDVVIRDNPYWTETQKLKVLKDVMMRIRKREGSIPYSVRDKRETVPDDVREGGGESWRNLWGLWK